MPDKLTILGEAAIAAADPKSAILECVTAPAQDQKYLVRLSCPEFTSLCPVTGQPDFAHIVVDYVPDKLLVESKALKLFMQSFRNHGAFHERCTMMIANRIQEATKCAWIRIYAFWYPRGGIPIDVFWQSGSPPPSLYIPAVDIPVYRAR
jgi:7-cyano-7-deazaguanine reductase